MRRSLVHSISACVTLKEEFISKVLVGNDIANELYEESDKDIDSNSETVNLLTDNSDDSDDDDTDETEYEDEDGREDYKSWEELESLL